MPLTSTQQHRLVMYGTFAAQGLTFAVLAFPWIMVQPGTPAKIVSFTGMVAVLICIALPAPPTSLRRTVLYVGYVAAVFGPNIVYALNYTVPTDENTSGATALAATVDTVFQCATALACYLIASKWNRQWQDHLCADTPKRPSSERTANRRPGIKDDLLRVAPVTFAGLFISTITQHVVLDSTNVTLTDSHHYSTVYGWIGALIGGATAGVKEEPVFVGLAVALWPMLTRRRLLGVIALTTVARTSIHLYYTHAPTVDRVDTIAGVILWCALWSTTNLLIMYYRPALLWAIVAGHGLYNIALYLRTAPDTLPAHGIYQAAGSVLFWALSAAGVTAASSLLTRTDTGAVLTRQLRRALPLEHASRDSIDSTQGPPSPE